MHFYLVKLALCVLCISCTAGCYGNVDDDRPAKFDDRDKQVFAAAEIVVALHNRGFPVRRISVTHLKHYASSFGLASRALFNDMQVEGTGSRFSGSVSVFHLVGDASRWQRLVQQKGYQTCRQKRIVVRFVNQVPSTAIQNYCTALVQATN
ncbi:MAG: hypothetical protein MK060_01170 [Blastomonas sp.]|uniref:hypothetical protein n=1 Tax=Blastomonas sp. TaxID=1909299 RepID=UPI0010FA638A|nr:hypothetical protein [Blastomonas sp.]